MKTLRFLLAILGLAHAAMGMAVESGALRLGVLPTQSPRALLTTYQPLREYLEHELKRPVEVSTATDFKAFYKAGLAGEYDLVVTAPHLVRLAQWRAGFRPLAAYTSPNYAVFIVAKDRPLASINDLRGKNLAIFDGRAVIVLDGLHWLRSKGLKAEIDYKVLETPSHNSVAHSVMSGESLLGITSPAGVHKWPAEFKERLDIYAELTQRQGVSWMAHPRLGPEYTKRIQALLLRFQNTPQGKQFFQDTGYKGLRVVSEKDMKVFDEFAKEVEEQLQN